MANLCEFVPHFSSFVQPIVQPPPWHGPGFFPFFDFKLVWFIYLFCEFSKFKRKLNELKNGLNKGKGTLDFSSQF
jgi:hypothetical protein